VSPGTRLSRRAVDAFLGLPLLPSWALSADQWSALRMPGHIALIRHALAPGTFDPPGFRLDDCATQRNLSDAGRVQARRIGDVFRANGIAAANVQSSQWCRCLDTAALLRLGEVTPQPLLNSFAQDRNRGDPQIDALRRWIGRQPLERPILLVTHQVVITALSGVFADSGEIVIMSREADGRFILRGRQPTV